MVPYFEVGGPGVNNANDIYLSRFLHFIAGQMKNDGMTGAGAGAGVRVVT